MFHKNTILKVFFLTGKTPVEDQDRNPVQHPYILYSCPIIIICSDRKHGQTVKRIQYTYTLKIIIRILCSIKICFLKQLHVS